MNSIRSLLVAAACAAASPSLASAQGPCVDQGWCHFAPIVPDPLLQGSVFGWSIDVHGDTAVVGSLVGDVVSVYERSGAQWNLVQILEDPHAGDNQFGANVAIGADFIAVGAHLDDTVSVDGGVVHVFRRDAGSWVFDATVTSTTPAAGGHFGRAVDVDGIWLAIGAPGEGTGGRVHVEMRTFAWWFHLTGLGTASSGQLGHSVAIDEVEGETAAVIVAGDPYCDVGGENAGRISILAVRPFSYTHDMLLSPVPQAGALFGYDVDVLGTRLVAGSSDALVGGVKSGAVDVFDFDLSGIDHDFDHVQRLTPCNDGGPLVGADPSFGFSVSLEGARLAVGAPGRDGAGTVGGAVEVFRPDPFGNGFTRDGLVFSAVGAQDDGFGWDVALAGERLLVASWGDDSGGLNHGSVTPVSLVPKSIAGGACPCDDAASAVHYGSGKPGTNGVPTLTAQSLPVPGEKTTLRVADAFVGAQPILVWGLVPAAVPFDGCTVLVEDLHLEFLPTIGVLGQVGIAWDVPSDPATCGLDVFVQAFMFDPGASGVFALAHTDGLHLTVGY
jgi:hypothetical protein